MEILRYTFAADSELVIQKVFDNIIVEQSNDDGSGFLVEFGCDGRVVRVVHEKERQTPA